MDLLDKEINSYSNKIQKMQQLKNTKKLTNLSVFNTNNSHKRNNYTNVPQIEFNKTKNDIPSKKTDGYQQYKELKLFKQMSNDNLDQISLRNNSNLNKSRKRQGGNTLRHHASQNILGNGNFVKSNNLNEIRLDTIYSPNN